MRWVSLFLLDVGAYVEAAATTNASFELDCGEIAGKVALENTTFMFAENLSTGLTVSTDGLESTCPTLPATAVDISRVALHITTSALSYTLMEAWLPQNWTGRFLHTGNSGTGGCIDFSQLAYGTSLGFATVGHSNGHNGTSAMAFYGQPEVLEDFPWRAMVTGTMVGQKVTRAFYNSSTDLKTCHVGCSTGGRQGFRTAQSHPDLFNGIVAGAPVINNDSLVSWYGYALETLGIGDNTSDTYLTSNNWAIIGHEVMKQCDTLDGASDGILEDTRACKFNSAPLRCHASNSTGCLTSTQTSTIKKLFASLVVDDQEIQSGVADSSESTVSAALASGAPTIFLTEWFRYTFYGDPTWQALQFNVGDALNSLQADPSNLHTFKTNLSLFRGTGGKIIHWHVQADQLASVKNSDRYYALVARDTAGNSTNKLDEFYRYFRISGTLHCAGGPGAYLIGQNGLARHDSPENNVLLAIAQWVEKGKAPDFVQGLKYVNNDPANAVDFTRKHYKEPLVNMYQGTNVNGSDEEGWHCFKN